jgi:predicted CXXCH cytochrome family protein
MRVLRAASLAVLFLILAGPVSAVQVGDRAVPFQGETLTGGKVDLAEEIGKRAILLKFGSIYCSTCVSSLEDIARIRKRFKASDLQIVGVNLDVYGIPRVRRFYRGYTNLITYPLIIDEKLAASRPYDIQSIPAHVVIDKEGVVRYVSTGATEEDLKILEDVVARVIRGEKGIEKLSRDLPLQLHLPINFSKTLQDSVYVVGKAKPGTRVSLALNGGSRQGAIAMRELFYIRTPLSLGSNYIEVSVSDPLGGKVTQGVVLFREPKMGAGIESPFPVYRFHNEKNEASCRKCHDLNPPEQGGQGFAAATQFCLGCHKELTGMRVVHGPITVGGCAPCHNFSSRPNRYEVLAQGQDLCFKCHEEKRKDLIRSFLHGPMSAGLCTICGLVQEELHKPVNDGACTACHEPHSSQRNDNFVKKPGNALCLSCHTGVNRTTHNHPFGVPPKKEQLIKLDKEGNLVCASCHEHHAGDEPKLLVKGGCAKCHA